MSHSRLGSFTCLIAILLINCPSNSFGLSELETSYENDMKGVRESGRNYYGQPIKNAKRTVNTTAGFWFGPRLGKRRKFLEKPEIEPQDAQAISEALNSGSWALVPIPRLRRTEYEKRQVTQFTPRLGRELPEKLSYFTAEDMINPISETGEQQQNQNFARVKFNPQIPLENIPLTGKALRNFLRKLSQ